MLEGKDAIALGESIDTVTTLFCKRVLDHIWELNQETSHNKFEES